MELWLVVGFEVARRQGEARVTCQGAFVGVGIGRSAFERPGPMGS